MMNMQLISRDMIKIIVEYTKHWPKHTVEQIVDEFDSRGYIKKNDKIQTTESYAKKIIEEILKAISPNIRITGSIIYSEIIDRLKKKGYIKQSKFDEPK